jgi:hypothetical protein
LILRDSKNSELWKTQNNSASSKNTLNLNDNGNLEIYSLYDQLVWQSTSLNLFDKYL